MGKKNFEFWGGGVLKQGLTHHLHLFTILRKYIMCDCKSPSLQEWRATPMAFCRGCRRTLRTGQPQEAVVVDIF